MYKRQLEYEFSSKLKEKSSKLRKFLRNKRFYKGKLSDIFEMLFNCEIEGLCAEYADKAGAKNVFIPRQHFTLSTFMTVLMEIFDWAVGIVGLIVIGSMAYFFRQPVAKFLETNELYSTCFIMILGGAIMLAASILSGRSKNRKIDEAIVRKYEKRVILKLEKWFHRKVVNNNLSDNAKVYRAIAFGAVVFILATFVVGFFKALVFTGIFLGFAVAVNANRNRDPL